jgi:hypothetical protein
MNIPKLTTVDKAELSIWGGSCTAAEAPAILAGFPGLDQLPFRIFDYTHSLEISRDTLPADWQYLERARLFGVGGDLSLRRVSSQFRWAFIGKPGAQPPQALKPEPYFTGERQSDSFVVHTGKSLLWGKNDVPDGAAPNFWDDRVARAALTYPVKAPKERAYITFNTYSQAGQVAFVWFTDLVSE